MLGANAKGAGDKVEHGRLPCFKMGLPRGFGIEEIFNFCLFKFKRTEDKLAGCDLVAKAFTDLANAKR